MASTCSSKVPRVIGAGLLAITVSLSFVWAQNENEQIGFSSTHVFDGDYFGENIDVLNGNLILTIPIGPTFKASSGFEYRLVLTYNSKIWMEKERTKYSGSTLISVYDEGLMGGVNEPTWESTSVPDRQMTSAGLGFRMHMGRIFWAKKHPVLTDQPEVALDQGWYYQDQNGTNHPIVYCPDLTLTSLQEPRSDPPNKATYKCPLDAARTIYSDNHYETVDASYMKAEKILTAGIHTGWLLYPGDGRVMRFEHHPHPGTNPSTGKQDPMYDPDIEELRGFYLTRIESVEKKCVSNCTKTNPVVKPYTYLEITYDPTLLHVITSINEYRWDPKATGTPAAARSIVFENTGSLCLASDPACTSPVRIHGGLVKAITLPASSGQLARYDFEYSVVDVSAPPQMSNCDDYYPGAPGAVIEGCPDPRNHIFSSVPILRRIVFPATGSLNAREVMELEYADALAATGSFGEVTRRILPTGARAQYTYGYYDYGEEYSIATSGHGKGGGRLVSGGKYTHTRHITRKSVYLDASDATADEWQYIRNGDLPRDSGGSKPVSQNPNRVHLIDPDGNEAVHYFWSGQDIYTTFLNSMNYRIDTFAGRWDTGTLVRREYFGYFANQGYNSNARANIHRTYRELQYADDGRAQETHAASLETTGYDSLGNETSRSEYDMDSPSTVRGARHYLRSYKKKGYLTAFERSNWVAHQLLSEKVYDGWTRLQRETQYVRTEEGKVRKEGRLAQPGEAVSSGEDLETIFCYDGDNLVGTPPASGAIYPYYDPTASQYGCATEPNLDLIRSDNVVLKRMNGGATDAEPAPLERMIEYKWQAGGYLAGKRFRGMTWWAFERDRDPSNGFITETRDTAEVRTRYSYDALGRLTRIDPDTLNGTEYPTEIRYPMLTRTAVLQGDPAVLAGIPHDSPTPCAATSGDYTCAEYNYDGLARLAETLKRRYDGSLASERRCYTPTGRLSEQSEWVGSAQTYQCGEVGGPPRTRTYYTAAGSTQVDPLGRPRRVLTADGFLSEYDYRGLDTIIRVHGINLASDAQGGLATTIQVRDAFDRLIRVDSLAGEPQGQDGAADALYAYDADDHLVEATLGKFDASGKFDPASAIQRRLFLYDPLGRMTEEVHPENGRNVYLAFDPLGNVLQRKDARGYRFRQTYDTAGRLLTEELEAGLGLWNLLSSHTYDTSQFGAPGDRPVGKLTRTLSYDDAGVLVSDRKISYAGLNGRTDREDTTVSGWDTWLTTTYRYNSMGMPETLQYPGDPAWSVPLLARYLYTNGYLSEARTENATNNIVARSVRYNPAGSLEAWEGGNGTRTTIQPDSRNRPDRFLVDRLPVAAESAQLGDPKDPDTDFLHLVRTLESSPHRVTSGEPAPSSDPSSPDAGTQAGKDGVRDPPGGGGSAEDTYTECHDGIDNDSDGAVDCNDTSCSTQCVENTSSLCSDFADNDQDALIDCVDPNCIPYCPEDAYSECHDGVDNDADGLVDCADPGCTIPCTPEESLVACSNGYDDNANLLTDCQEPYCQSLFCGPQQAEDISSNCADRKDNDWDGAFDCEDADCWNCVASPDKCIGGVPIPCRHWDSGVYEYDGAGNIRSMTAEGQFYDEFLYDKASRLIFATLSSADYGSMEYIYDDFGNMTSWRKYGNWALLASRLFNVDPKTNRIHSSSMNLGAYAPFQYDASGNQLQDDRHRYQYDARGRVTRIATLGGNVIADFKYDSSGHRISKAQGDRMTYFLRDSEGQVLTEFVRDSATATPVWASSYVYAGRQQLGVLRTTENRVEPPPPIYASAYTSGTGWLAYLWWAKSPSPGIAGYIVHRRTDGMPAAPLMTIPISGRIYEDRSNLQAGQTYFYSVQAIDQDGNRSSLSLEARVTTVSGAPNAPAWVSPYVGPSNTSISLYWTVTPADDPRLKKFTGDRYWSTSGGGPWTLDLSHSPIPLGAANPSSPPSSYTYEDGTNLVAGRYYFYRLCSVGNDNQMTCQAAPTNQACVSSNGCSRFAPTTPPPATGLPEVGTLQPPAAFGAAASPEDPRRIELSWLPVGGSTVIGYRVYKEVIQGGVPALEPVASISGLQTSSFALTFEHGIQANTLYRLRIASVDAANLESPPSGVSVTRTRSTTLGVPRLRIHKVVNDPQDPYTAGVHGDLTRQSWFRFTIDDTVSRNGDTVSRFGFRVYFRKIGTTTWAADDAASRVVHTGMRTAEGSSRTYERSLRGIFTTDMEVSNGQVITISPGGCEGVSSTTNVCGLSWWVIRHGCEVGDYAFSTVRGRIVNGEFVVEEESLLSAPDSFDPYDLFRNVRMYDSTNPARPAIRLRAWTPCKVGAEGFGQDGHLTCDSVFKTIVGYRIYWMPIPYCGVKGYNVWKLPNCYNPINFPKECGDGPQGQIYLKNYETCVTPECAGLSKLNTELLTRYHFDTFPPLDANGYYTGTVEDLVQFVTIEMIPEPGSPFQDVRWQDRFSCPLSVAGISDPSHYPSSPQRLVCAAGSIYTDGQCLCRTHENSDGPCSNYQPDGISRCGMEGEHVLLEPGTEHIHDLEGYYLLQDIWVRNQSQPYPNADPGWTPHSCDGLWVATAHPLTGTAEQPETLAGADLQIVGIAQAFVDVPLESSLEPNARATALPDPNVPEELYTRSLSQSSHQVVSGTSIPSNDVLYYHTDHLGSVRLTTDQRGFIVRKTLYWPFGDESLPAGWDTNTHRFTGHERDTETGLDYMLARYYSAGLSRFLSVDPLGASARPENPQSWNRYSYVLNNPLRFVDPDGTIEQETKKVFAEASSNSNNTKAQASAGAVQTKISGEAGSLTVGAATVGAEVHSGGSVIGASASGAVLSAESSVSSPGGSLRNDSSVKGFSASAAGEGGLSSSGAAIKGEVGAALVEGATTSSVSVSIPGTSKTVSVSFSATGGVGAAAGASAGVTKTDSGGVQAGVSFKVGAPLFGGLGATVKVEPKSQ